MARAGIGLQITADSCITFNTADSCVTFDTADSCVTFDTADSCVTFDTADSCVTFGTADSCVTFGTADRCVTFDTADSCVTFDTLQPEFRLNSGNYRLNSHPTENTLLYHYKNLPFYVTAGNNEADGTRHSLKGLNTDTAEWSIVTYSG